METNLLKRIMIAVPEMCRIFRNNTGTVWVGKKHKQSKTIMVIEDPRPLKAGLFKGSSDLIGWTSITITPEMIGRKMAIFTAIEVKTAKGRVLKDQETFLRNVTDAGGIGSVATDPDRVGEMIRARI